MSLAQREIQRNQNLLNKYKTALIKEMKKLSPTVANAQVEINGDRVVYELSIGSYDLGVYIEGDDLIIGYPLDNLKLRTEWVTTLDTIDVTLGERKEREKKFNEVYAPKLSRLEFHTNGFKAYKRRNTLPILVFALNEGRIYTAGLRSGRMDSEFYSDNLNGVTPSLVEAGVGEILWESIGTDSISIEGETYELELNNGWKITWGK